MIQKDLSGRLSIKRWLKGGAEDLNPLRCTNLNARTCLDPADGFDQPIRGNINERGAVSTPLVDISMPSVGRKRDHLRELSGCQKRVRDFVSFAMIKSDQYEIWANRS